MANEKIFAASPLPIAAGRVIVAPFQFIASGEDNLRVVSANSLAGVRIAIQGRWYSERGTAEAFAHEHTPASDRSIRTEDFALGPGAVLNAIAYVSNGAPLYGQTFLSVQLVRGRGTSGRVLGTLLQGYVTARNPVAWPGSPLISSLDTEPLPRAIMGTTPAVNTDWGETVPTGARWEIIGAYASLNAGVTGIARSVILQIGDGANVIQSANPSKDHTDAILRYYSWAPNLPATISSGSPVYQQPMAQRVIMRAGWQLYTNTIGIGGGDQWSAPNLTVREWLDL